MLPTIGISPPVVNLDDDFILNHDESGESGKRHTLGNGTARLGPSVNNAKPQFSRDGI